MGAKKPRFIAGAVCPRCGAIDRIVVVEHESGRRRTCIVCDFSDEVPATGSAGETSTIRIVDVDPKK